VRRWTYVRRLLRVDQDACPIEGWRARWQLSLRMTELGGVGFEGWQSERDHRGELIRAGTRWASGLTTRASSQLPVDPRREVCAALGG